VRYLVDTHILIWILTNPEKLSKNIVEAINSADEVIVSSISFWEISLKFSIGKLELENIQPDDLPGIAQKCGISILEVGSDIMSTFHKLPKLSHKDPFDRLIIWTAISEKTTLISHDSSFSEYEQHGLLLLK
jgi:PIN domain nuclease of toxin-antitoxin system